MAFFHARVKRRETLAFVYRAAMSGSSFFKAVVSMRLLVTAFHVIFQSVPVSVSVSCCIYRTESPVCTEY